ncbi:hypothetical protein BD413DRAFT_574811 [Trametes elegans]|nr:hypothetical protein BD413DRAFT_574811 [Trametes elegans]
MIRHYPALQPHHRVPLPTLIGPHMAAAAGPFHLYKMGAVLRGNEQALSLASVMPMAFQASLKAQRGAALSLVAMLSCRQADRQQQQQGW